MTSPKIFNPIVEEVEVILEAMVTTISKNATKITTGIPKNNKNKSSIASNLKEATTGVIKEVIKAIRESQTISKNKENSWRIDLRSKTL
jgi:hypothetical protein